jgi:hypothetical protein
MAIDWQDVLITVASTVGGGTVILGAAAWLIKTALTSKLTQETEAFKARLKADGDAEIEKLKDSLEKVAFEHQVRFSSLHEKRAEIIADLYARLVAAQRDGNRFVTVEAWDDNARREAYEATHTKIVDFYNFVEKNRIYLPEPVCDLLKTFVADVRRGIIGMKFYAPVEPSDNPEHNENRVTVVEHVYETFQEKIPEARAALEKEFRTILGG